MTRSAFATALKLTVVLVLSAVAACSAALIVLEGVGSRGDPHLMRLSRELLPTATAAWLVALVAAVLFRFRRIALGLLVVAFGAVAAIAAVRLARGTYANAPAALSDVRTMIAAQAAYRTASGGWYAGELRCLTAPAACIPGYAQHETFLDSEFTSLTTKSGYRREFGRARGQPDIPPTDTDAFAYLAVPVTAENGRSFCGDASGEIVEAPPGSPPPRIENGRCVGGQPLR